MRKPKIGDRVRYTLKATSFTFEDGRSVYGAVGTVVSIERGEFIFMLFDEELYSNAYIFKGWPLVAKESFLCSDSDGSRILYVGTSWEYLNGIEEAYEKAKRK